MSGRCIRAPLVLSRVPDVCSSPYIFFPGPFGQGIYSGTSSRSSPLIRGDDSPEGDEHPKDTTPFDVESFSRTGRDKLGLDLYGEDAVHTPPICWGAPRIETLYVVVKGCDCNSD